MLKAPKVVYGCNHLVNEIQEEIKSDLIIREEKTEGIDYDTICSGFVIKYIDSVFQILDESVEYYYENIDFIKYQNNKIQWITSHKPLNDTSYSIEYQRANRLVKEYLQEECPKCMGNGWYINAVNGNGSKMNCSEGTEKLVQDFMKILLTYKSSDYGSTLHEFVSAEINKPDEFIRQIINTVYQCEVKYKQMQSDQVNTGVVLEPIEKLRSAIVTNCEYDAELNDFFLSVVITSDASGEAEISLKL
jgi:excinuclease UvrABC ATPase subunit